MANATRDVRSFDLGAGALPARSISQGDGQGGRTGLWVDDGLGTDFYSSVARSARVVETMERLLGAGELCESATPTPGKRAHRSRRMASHSFHHG